MLGFYQFGPDYLGPSSHIDCSENRKRKTWAMVLLQDGCDQEAIIKSSCMSASKDTVGFCGQMLRLIGNEEFIVALLKGCFLTFPFFN